MPTAPVLSWDPPSLRWVWDGPNPVEWQIDFGPGPGGPWAGYETVPGAGREWVDPEPDTWFTVTGYSEGLPVTERSNAVQTS